MATEFKAMNDLFKLFSGRFAKTEGKHPWELTEKDVEKFFEFIEKFNEITQTSDVNRTTDETSTDKDAEYKNEAEAEQQPEPEWNPDEVVESLKAKYSAYVPGVWIKNIEPKAEDNPSCYRKYGCIRSVGYTIDYKAKVVNPYIAITWLEDMQKDSRGLTDKIYLLNNKQLKIIPSITSIDFIKKLMGKVLIHDPAYGKISSNCANLVELITQCSKIKSRELLVINSWYVTSLIWDQRGKLLNTTIDGKPILQALFEEP